jgi:uncharacterized membrane protein YdjX (TVP38/TMEM64 family)
MFGLVLAVMIMRELLLTELIRPEDLASVRYWILGHGTRAPIAFILGYAAATVAFVPPVPLIVLGGLAFGPIWGTAYTAVASAIGVSVPFLIARYVARTRVQGWLMSHRALGRIDRVVAHHGFRAVVVTRLFPIAPDSLQSYAYGLTSIGFFSHALASWLCLLPVTVAFTAAAAAVFTISWNPPRALWLLAVAALLLLAFTRVPRYLRGRRAILADLLGLPIDRKS